MSDFENMIRAISTAYSEKMKVRKSFIAEWSKLLAKVIRPKLEYVKTCLPRPLLLDLKEDKGGIVLTVFPPDGKPQKTLSYDPNETTIIVEMDFGRGDKEKRSQRFPLEDISPDLIDGQIEDFLKTALHL